MRYWGRFPFEDFVGRIDRSVDGFGGKEWWARQDSNLQPDRYERPALTN
jgi:hypothetical protein